MATREEKAEKAASLKKRLEEAKKRRGEKKASKGNGQTGAAAPAPAKKAKKAKRAKVKVKKAAPAKKKNAAKVKPAKKAAPAKKKGAAKKAKPAKKATPTKTRKIKPIKNLAKLVDKTERDKKTGLTKLQVALIKIVQKNENGIGIKDLIRHVYTDEEVSAARKKKTATGTVLEIDRPIRNAVRRPRTIGLIELDEETKLYHFVKWE